MHELSIALSIVDVAQEEAASRGVKVEAVHLRLGELAGVVREALLSAYTMASERTALEGTNLLIEDVPVLVNCPTCHASRRVHSIQALCCAECGTFTSDVVQGRELLVTALEVAA
jgi:hydrogenase nickel incorporation protein HypA/HybF